MTATIPQARVTEENHARAVLARLCGAHHLPIAPDGIEWRHLGARHACLAVTVPTRADVDLWAAAMGVEAKDDDIICDSDIEPGVWIVDRLRFARLSDWLPGVALRVRWHELRYAFPKDGAR